MDSYQIITVRKRCAADNHLKPQEEEEEEEGEQEE